MSIMVSAQPMKLSSQIALGTAVGIVLGGLYLSSPLTVWFVIALVGLFAAAARGLGERERRYLWTIVAVAVAIRCLALVLLFLQSSPNVMTSFFWDGDGVYIKRRAMTMRAFWLDMPVSPVLFSRAFDHGYGWSSYLYIVAYLQYLTGLSPFGVHLFNVALFLAAALVLYRLARSSYGRAPALVGVALMLFFPTLIAWSVSALKESLFLFLSVLGLKALVVALRSERFRYRLLGGIGLLGAIAVNRSVRNGAGVIMVAGMGMGMLASGVIRRIALAMVVLGCLPLVAVSVWQTPSLQAKVMSQIKAAATQHRGAVNTDGNTYKLLDPRFYPDPGGKVVESMTPDEALHFVVRGLVSFVIVPLPWQAASLSEMMFLAQQVIWYLLLVFACIGTVAGLRRDALLTCLLLGLSTVGAAIIALNSGNVGSLVRFRDTIVPFIVWLSGLGAVAVASAAAPRRSEGAILTKRRYWPAARTERA